MAPHPGTLDAHTAASTSSSSLSAFPPLTLEQRRHIERTLAHLSPHASTWADLIHAQQRLRAQEGDHRGPDEEDDDGLYELWLKLVWQQGVTWHDKWNSVQHATHSGDGGHLPPPVSDPTLPRRRNHHRRPSDNLDLLRRKLDRVTLDPAAAARPAERPKSTPPRPLLVQRSAAAGEAGYSSSDDQFAGVPTPRPRRLSLLDARLDARRRAGGATTTDDDGRGGVSDDALFDVSLSAPLHSTPAPLRRRSTSTPRAVPLPTSPPPPAPLSPSRHPLLHARLSALGTSPRLPPPAADPPAPGPAPAPNPALDSLALSFSRLRLLLPTFAHWSALTSFHTQRHHALAARRAAWLARCALRTWRARVDRWMDRARDARAERFRVGRLGRGALGVWREAAQRRRERRTALEEVAADQWGEWEAKRARDVWDWWVRRTAWRVKEREVRARRDQVVVREAWDVWSDKQRQADHEAHLLSLASTHHARRLASLSLSTWRSRLYRLSSLSHTATSHSHVLLARLASTHLRTWRLSARLSLLSRSRAHALASSALNAWSTAHDHLAVDLSGRADALVARRGAQLRAVAFAAWADAAAQRARRARAAEGVDRVRVLRRAMGGWAGRVGGQRVQERKAEVVRDFMQVRGAWRRWCEVWLSQTRQKLRDEKLVAQVQVQQVQSIRSDAVQAWKARVIARKSLEQDASDFFDRKAVFSAFKRWTAQAYAADDRLVLAYEHRAVKLEELRDRIFHTWLVSTRRAAALRARLAAFSADRDARTRVAAYDKWREMSLRGLERAAAARRDERDKAEAWEYWKGRTKTLTAVRHHNGVLAVRALDSWRLWTTPREMLLRAVETDHGAITSGALQVWRIKTGAKRALKSLSGRMRLGSSPGSSPPSRLSPSTRLASASSASSPSPATPAPPPPVLTGSTQSMSAGTPLRSSAASLGASLASATSSSTTTTAATSYRLSAPASARSPSVARSSASASASTSGAPPHSAARPRTRPSHSAEYGASPLRSEPDPRPRPSPGPRTGRSYSVVSRLSTASAGAVAADARSVRSLPGPGRGGAGAVFSSDEDEEDEEEVRGPRTRSEGGARERDRDVRAGYAALRARLRAAAVAAKGR
ncbi:hypothetical protein DMC30DRAFT_434024 [Rhodotorula diobovata]|uniref:Sfi1 spindle body domain-containing protein n=1 Tax=Rhodotorula diobovata TaxID=5288 RepID=A0A5C5G0Y5_9BASI|nr:hypothetical protein DMC30DRAFT_434024 [Rhodotorula diobovata]